MRTPTNNVDAPLVPNGPGIKVDDSIRPVNTRDLLKRVVENVSNKAVEQEGKIDSDIRYFKQMLSNLEKDSPLAIQLGAILGFLVGLKDSLESKKDEEK